MVDVLRPNRPWVKVETPELDQPNDIGFGAGDVHHPGPLRWEPDLDCLERCVLGGPLVIDGILVDGPHETLQHRGPAENSPDRPFGDHGEMIGDIELGPTLLGEDDPSRAGDPYLLTADTDSGLVTHRLPSLVDHPGKGEGWIWSSR